MTTVSVTEARAKLSRLVESAATEHERFELTRRGDRVAVLLGADDFDSLLETLDVLGNLEEVEAIRAGLADLGRDVASTDDVRTALRQRTRRVPGEPLDQRP